MIFRLSIKDDLKNSQPMVSQTLCLRKKTIKSEVFQPGRKKRENLLIPIALPARIFALFEVLKSFV